MTNAELASRLFLQLACILLACGAVGWFTTRVRQPFVIAEMIAGFLLGPSLLGWLAPDVSAWLFPADAKPALYVISQLGLVLYMFCVGLEFRTDLLSRFGRAAASISAAGIVVPALLGGGLAIALLPRGDLFAAGVTPLPAALFMASALSITAFPVLARIISERGIGGTAIGSLALAAGAIDDAAAWILLAFVLSLFAGNALLAIASLTGVALYVGAMFAVRPVLQRMADRTAVEGALSAAVLTTLLMMLAFGAWFTEAAGVHAVFGAFLLGVAVPRGLLADRLRELIEPVTKAALVPPFFVYSGLNTQLGLLGSPVMWGIAALILVTACVGKGVACWGAARLAGWPSREAMAVATLMNTRGMVELILLNIGLQRGIITPTLFTMMVIMAIATTVMTGPLFTLLWERGTQHTGDASKTAYVQ
jgi:Kef-type K+ transport system membrane component KefB